MLSKNKIVEEKVYKIVQYLRSILPQTNSIRQVALKTKLSYNSCYKTIQELNKNDIVTVTKKQNNSFCALVKSQKVALLLSLADKIKIVNGKIGRVLKELVQEADVNSMVLYGSYAKNKQRKGSDIDIFCIAENNDIIKKAKYVSLKYNVTIEVIVATKEEFEEMLTSSQRTVGK